MAFSDIKSMTTITFKNVKDGLRNNNNEQHFS